VNNYVYLRDGMQVIILFILQQVAQFINLPDAMLHGFLEKIKKDEAYELALIKERY